MSDVVARVTVFNESNVRVVTVAAIPSPVKVVRVNVGPPGRDGDAIGQPPPIPFEWNNVSTRVVYTLGMDAFIVSVLVSIETAFDGNGASLKIGTVDAPELLAAQNQIDPTQIADFEINSSMFLPEGTSIVLTTIPGTGASAGNGFLVIKFIAI